MKRRSEYIFGALTFTVGLYCLGTSIAKSFNYFETKRTTRIKIELKDSNGNPVITQISSYTPFDTDNDGKYDTFDIMKETQDDTGKIIASKKESKKLEALTEQELELLKLK